MISLPVSTLSQKDVYKLMIGSIVPRPIAWISTCDENGVGNLAPFSFFNGVSSDPACIAIAITRKSSGEKKDTLLNIEKTGQFVINIANEALVEKLNQTSAEYEYGIDELIQVGLTPLQSQLIKPQRVREAPIQIECELYQKLEIGEGGSGSSSLIIGKILVFHFINEIYLNGRVDITQLKPIGRLGGPFYCRVSEVFEIIRPL